MTLCYYHDDACCFGSLVFGAACVELPPAWENMEEMIRQSARGVEVFGCISVPMGAAFECATTEDIHSYESTNERVDICVQFS